MSENTEKIAQLTAERDWVIERLIEAEGVPCDSGTGDCPFLGEDDPGEDCPREKESRLDCWIKAARNDLGIGEEV